VTSLLSKTVSLKPPSTKRPGQVRNIPELRTILKTIAKDHATVEGYEVNRDFPRVGRRIMLLNARKVFYEAGTHTTTL
jgi:chemotaxis protein methyltransferase CheR